MTTRKTTSRLSPERRKAEIIEAALEVFKERGFFDTVVAEIAQRAGVVEGSIYRYFENKRALMFSIAEAWFDKLLADNEETLNGIEGTWNQLHFLVFQHLIAIHTEPELARLVFQHLRPEPDYRKSRLFDANRAYTQRLVKVLQAGIDKGELSSSVSPSLVRDMIYGGIEHRSWSFLFGSIDFDPATVTDEVIGFVRSGIETSPRPADNLEQAVARLENVVASLKAN